jgi:hypothetical protein
VALVFWIDCWLWESKKVSERLPKLGNTELGLLVDTD